MQSDPYLKKIDEEFADYLVGKNDWNIEQDLAKKLAKRLESLSEISFVDTITQGAVLDRLRSTFDFPFVVCTQLNKQEDLQVRGSFVLGLKEEKGLAIAFIQDSGVP